MLKFITQACLCTALLLLSTNPATAAVVYELNLSANGNVDAIQVQITVPTFVTSPLFVVDPNDPEMTLFSSGNLSLPDSVVGIEALPTVTRIGITLGDAEGQFAILSREYAQNFFVFSRLPDELGTFTSLAGSIEATGPYSLRTATPSVQLTVSGTPDMDPVAAPEPASVITTGAGASLLLLGAFIRRKLR